MSSLKKETKSHWKRKQRLAAMKGYNRLESAECLGSEMHVAGLVEFLCHDEDLNIPNLPDSIKHSLFSMIVSQFLSTFLKSFYGGVTGQNLMGHHMDLYYSEAKELEVSKVLQEIEEEEESGTKPVAVRDIEALVDQILGHKEINIGMLPDSVERPLYSKSIHVVVHCIQYILLCTEYDFCGYSFRGTFDIKSDDGEKKDPVRMVRADLGDHRHEVDREILQEVIEDATRDISGGYSHMLEKQVIAAVYALAIYTVFETLKELVVNVLGDNFRLRLMPGEPGSKKAKLAAAAVATANTTTGAPGSGSPKKRRRVFTTKWVKKRLMSPEKASAGGANGGPSAGGGGFLSSLFGSPKKNPSAREGTGGTEDEEVDGNEDGRMPLWTDNDDDAGIEATWRNVEGETLQHYLNSYHPPRTIPFGAKLTVRDEQADFFTRQILRGGEYSIPGIPEAVEMLVYKQVVRTGMQRVLTTFHTAVSNVAFFGHHFELDIEEGKVFTPIKKRRANMGAVTALAQTLIDDPNVNLSLLPDILERQLYVNVILISLLLVQNICDTSSMDILGHCLEFTLKPISDDTTAKLRKKLMLDMISSQVPKSVIDDETLSAYVKDDRDGDGAGDGGELYADMMTAIYRISLYAAKEALQDMAIFLLEDGYVMRVAPGAPQTDENGSKKDGPSTPSREK